MVDVGGAVADYVPTSTRVYASVERENRDRDVELDTACLLASAACVGLN